jgi:hypothetical protein
MADDASSASGGDAASEGNSRALRFEQAIIAIALLTGFVFRWFWMIPLVGVLLLAPLVAGGRANLFARIYEGTLGAHLAAHPAIESAGTTRFTRLVEVALLALGSLFVFLGADGFGWVFALPVAAITVVAATTGINLVAVVRDRRGPHAS